MARANAHMEKVALSSRLVAIPAPNSRHLSFRAGIAYTGVHARIDGTNQ